MEPSLLFNLADFDRDILRPSASAFSRAMSTRRRASSFADMVAGFFWLLFGLDAEYFPEAHAQSLFSQRFGQFVSDFQEHYSRWGYVFDPEFEPLLFSACNFGKLVQRAEDLRVHGASIAKAAIRSALVAESTLKRSAAAQLFMGLLSFEPNLLTRVISEGVAMGGPDEIIDRDTIVLGFLDVISYMRILVDLSNALRPEEAETVAKSCAHRLRQLTRWRVNRHGGIDGPFKQGALFVNDEYLDHAYSMSQVDDIVDGLLGEWGFTHVKAASAS